MHFKHQLFCQNRTKPLILFKLFWNNILFKKKKNHHDTKSASPRCTTAKTHNIQHAEGPSPSSAATHTNTHTLITQYTKISRRLRTWHLAYRRQEKRSLARPHARAFNVRRCDRVTIKAARSIVLLVCLFRRWKINCGCCGVEKSATGVGCKFVTPLFCGGGSLGGIFGCWSRRFAGSILRVYCLLCCRFR